MHVRGYVREDGGGVYIMWLEGDSVSVQTTVSPQGAGFSRGTARATPAAHDDPASSTGSAPRPSSTRRPYAPDTRVEWVIVIGRRSEEGTIDQGSNGNVRGAGD